MTTTQMTRTAREYLRVSKDPSGEARSTSEQHVGNVQAADDNDWHLGVVGISWGIEHIHEPHCPEHEDNHEALDLRVSGPESVGAYTEAEAIWLSTLDDDQ